MNKIKVNLGKRSYDILVSHDKLHEIGSTLKKVRLGTDAIIITNPLIKKLFLKKIKSSLLASGFSVREEIVPDSEKSKSETYCIKLLNNISRLDGSKKRLFIIALGGGVSDMAVLEEPSDRFDLDHITHRCRCSVRIDVVDVLRGDISMLQCTTHAVRGTLGGGLHHLVLAVGRHPESA